MADLFMFECWDLMADLLRSEGTTLHGDLLTVRHGDGLTLPALLHLNLLADLLLHHLLALLKLNLHWSILTRSGRRSLTQLYRESGAGLTRLLTASLNSLSRAQKLSGADLFQLSGALGLLLPGGAGRL